MNPAMVTYLANFVRFHIRKNNMREIQHVVGELIHHGAILTIEKTTHAYGKRVVTVGPYQTATGEKMFAMYIGADKYIYAFADTAAKEFIGYVNRDKAREAVREWLRQNG